MARARNIKPGFWRNEALVELPFQTRLLFIGLWNMADREGRLENRPKKIKLEIFPADDVDISLEITRLSEAGLVKLYQARGIKCIEVTNFKKHQNPHHREAASELPSPDESDPQPPENKEAPESPGLDRGEPEESRADSGFLNPDSGFQKELCASGDADARPPEKSEAATPLYSDEFNRFWDAYPSKKGKKPAAEKFRSVRKKNPGAQFLEFLIEDVTCRARGSDWLKDGGKYIPMASTYLNQERWNDPAPNVSHIQSRHNGFDDRDYSEGLIEGVSDDAANF